MRAFLVALFLLVLAAGGAAAQSGERVLAATLENGLRVLLQEDHRSPIVSFQMWYRVGSRNEARGATGIAHFLEHMMFKGTPTHGQGQFASLVAVGDFKAPEVLAKIRAKFGKIPRGATPPPVLAVEPPQNGERRVVVAKQAQLPIVYVGYHVPNQTSADAFPLEMLSTILSEGRASRLYKRLVYERQLALEAGGDYNYFSQDPNLFWFWATPMPGQTAEAMEEALLAEMETLKKEPVTDEELQRAKNQVEATFVFQEDSVHRRAALLARFELIGVYADKDRFLERLRAVTAADVQRVARAYFADDRKNVGVLLPRP